MAAKRGRAKRARALSSIAAAPPRPPAAAIARAGIAALNERRVAQLKRRLAERAGTARETAKIVAPMIELVRQDERAVKATEARRRLILPRGKPKITFPKLSQRVESHVRAGSILNFVGPPYFTWGDNSASDPISTWGTWVADGSAPDPRINSTTNATSSAGAWSSAGIGTWFIPAASSTWVRFGVYAPYEYNWRDDSNWFAAHTHGFIAILVQSFDLRGGDRRDEVDRRIPLWSDGSSWQEDHADSSDGYYPSDTYFLASNARQYAVWVWCSTSADAHSGSLAYSYAFGTLSASVGYMVFEQWT
jgi:hypothetical protein